MPVMEDLERSDSRLGVRDGAWLAEQLTVSIVEGLDPGAVGSDVVLAVWVSLDRVERLAANAKVLLAACVAETGEWRRAGFRSPGEHLACLSGTSTRDGCRMLEHALELSDLAVVGSAMRAGVLSREQVDAIVPAAVADPAAQARLVGVAASTNVSELRAECLRTAAVADPDPDVTHRRIRSNRYARTSSDAEGAWNLRARGTVEDGARFRAGVGADRRGDVRTGPGRGAFRGTARDRRDRPGPGPGRS